MSAPPIDANQIPAPVSAEAIGFAEQSTRVMVVLMIVATALFLARVWTKVHPVYRLTNDDYIATAAYVFTMVSTGLYLRSTPWAFYGDPSKWTLHNAERALMHATISDLFWTQAMPFTKISIAVMLLRFEQVRSMRIFLWFMISLLFLQDLYGTIFQLLHCRPMESLWDLSGKIDRKCWSQDVVNGSALTSQLINIGSDWVFALIPISFLRKVQRPLRERITVGVLMGLGLFASIASIIKITYAVRIDPNGDMILSQARFAALSSIEALLIFSASCVPYLRRPVQRALEHFGLLTVRRSYPDSSYQYRNSTTTHSQSYVNTSGTTSGIKMKNFRSGYHNSSDTNILTNTEAGTENRRSEVSQGTEPDEQREQDDLERIQGTHTPSLPLDDSWDTIDQIQKSHTPPLTPRTKQRHESIDERIEGDSSKTQRK